MNAITRDAIRQAVGEDFERFANPERMLDILEAQFATDWEPGNWDHWRHGGWYVGNLHYPSGAVGCVSNNYTDKRWRIACDPRPFEEQPSFRNRRDAALAERELIALQIS